MSGKITGAEYPLSKIVSSDFDYEIPSYQRPYAWTVEQAGELFDDLYDFYESEEEDSYFLGSIVLIKEDGKPRAEVIDGQQRLTSLTILFAGITSLLAGDERADFYRYIREPGSASQGLKPKPRLALRDRDRAFFQEYIQGLKLQELGNLDAEQVGNEARKNICLNARLFLERLENAYGKSSKDLCEFGSFVVQRCFLVAVSTPSQQSAFRVFSVLNSRGLDLLPTDIIKSDVIGRLKPSLRDEYTERWEEIEVQTGRNDFAELFGHIRMIYAKTKARRSLLEEFREYVIGKKLSSEELIAKVIEPYAEAYLIAKNQDYVSTASAKEVNQLLWWLNRIDNSDWIPSAIVFLARQSSNHQQVLAFFIALERLAAYMHICGRNVNYRIERYALVLTSLLSHKSHASLIEALNLTEAEKKELKTTLSGDVYRIPSRRRNYLLQRLDSFYSDGAAKYDSNLLTVEHVLPQTVSAGSEWSVLWPDEEIRDKWVHRLANLVPLTQKRNSAAQNFTFAKKKSAYFGGKQGVSSYILTTQVLNTPEWNPKVVKQRQAEILGVLHDQWELN